jgi:hypothetical protein
MRAFTQDAMSAFRLMRRQPAFSLFVILTRGVGIGAATAVFTLVRAVLLQDLPFSDPDRLVWMYNARQLAGLIVVDELRPALVGLILG